MGMGKRKRERGEIRKGGRRKHKGGGGYEAGLGRGGGL